MLSRRGGCSPTCWVRGSDANAADPRKPGAFSSTVTKISGLRPPKRELSHIGSRQVRLRPLFHAGGPLVVGSRQSQSGQRALRECREHGERPKRIQRALRGHSESTQRGQRALREHADIRTLTGHSPDTHRTLAGHSLDTLRTVSRQSD